MPMKILAISGSLRHGSSNSAILRLTRHIGKPDFDVEITDAIARLPFFNPDLDRALDDPELPAPVRALREAVGRADALIISSPEYAHGLPGVLKNALDWLVGGEEMVNRRVALFNTAPHATHAQAQLAETLRTMTTVLVHDAFLSVALPRGASDEELAGNDAIVADVNRALVKLGGQRELTCAPR